MPGFKKGRKLNKIGLKAQELPQKRLLIAGLGQASCEFMFEETRAYVRGRKAFGRTLGHLQTIQHKLAEMKTEIVFGRTFVDHCFKQHDTGLDSQQASMCKYWVSEIQNSIASRCLQMHGGWGYMWEYRQGVCRLTGAAHLWRQQ